MKLTQSDWPIFSETTYTFKPLPRDDKDTSYYIHPDLLSETRRQEELTRLSSDFMNYGMQQRLMPIILAHDYLSPRLFVLGQSPATYFPPLFSCQRWELQSDILCKKLSAIVRYKGTGYRGDYTLFIENSSQKASVEPNQNEESEDEKKNSFSSTNLSPIVGQLIGVVWTTEFGYPSLPYLPLHITRPKERILLFQVILPPECEIYIPSHLHGYFIPFEILLRNNLPAISGIPSLVSRFAIKSMVSKSEQEQPTTEQSVQRYNDAISNATTAGENSTGNSISKTPSNTEEQH